MDLGSDGQSLTCYNRTGIAVSQSPLNLAEILGRQEY